MGMGELLYEWDDLDGAMRHLTEGITLGDQSGSTSIVLPGHAILARVKWARRDPEGALRVIQDDEATAQAMTPSSRDLNRIVAYGARLRLAQGDVGGAARLLGQRGIGVNDDLDHLNVLEHVVLARVLITRREHDAALDLLERLLGVAEATGSMGGAWAAL